VTSRPTATAVVCTKDRPEFLGGCLESVAAALGPGDDLVVVECGDSGAAGVVAALGVPTQHLRVDRPGKSRQLNAGAAVAAGDVLVLTDDDCRVPADWVDGLVAPFTDAGVGAAFGPVRGLTAVPGGEAPPALAPGPAPERTWEFAHGASMAVRRLALEAIGGFDERLGPGAPVHGEEHDVVLRLRERGWRDVIAPVGHVEHLEWRDDREQDENLLVYERGGGAVVGAALRRHPVANLRLLKLRLGYQRALYGDAATRGRWFGPRTTAAFAGGLVRGLRLGERRWL
jgi:GT2 family glycosyltransferase